MGLTLVTGPANSGKTGIVYGVVRAAVEGGREPVILVPSAPDARRARIEFSRETALGLRVVPAAAFLTDQWSLWGDGRGVLTSDQRRYAAREAIGRFQPRALAASAASPGFVRFVERLAGEVAASEPGALIAEGVLDGEIASLLRVYREVLRESALVEPGEAWRKLGEVSQVYGGPVVIHRFLNLEPGLEAFVTGCADRNDVLVSLTWVPDRIATLAAGPLVERLTACATARMRSTEAAGVTAAELERVEAGLMTMPAARPAEGAVWFGQATGPEAEAALVAREARRLADEFGAGGVAVIVRDAAGRIPLLARALETQNIPYDLDIVEPLTAVPLGSAAVDLLQGVAEPGDRKALVAFLATPFSGLERGVRELLDARWRRDRTESVDALVRDLRAADGRVGRIVELAWGLLRGDQGTGTTRDWKCLLDSLLSCRYGLVPCSDPAFERDVTAHRAAYDALESLAQAHDGDTPGSAAVLDALRETRTASRSYDRPGRLQVVEAHRIGARRFDGIVVAGLDDAGFSPSRPADVVEDTAARMVPVGHTDAGLRERLLFYNTVTRARRRLILVRQEADADGVARRPSPFWDEMLDFFRDPSEGPEAPGSVRLPSMGSADVVGSAPAFGAGRAFLREAVRAGRTPIPTVAPARRGVLSDPLVLADRARRDVFSATELETYRACPYRWFYERTIRPEPLEGEVGPMQSGRLVHEVLRVFYEDALPARLGCRRVDHDNLDKALGLLEEVLSTEIHGPDMPAAVDLFEEDQVARAAERARTLVMADADFLPECEPSLFEWTFGPEQAAVTIGDFRIKGRVDRIDQGPEGLVVMDYKLGKPPTAAEAKDGRALQVMMYAHAVETVLDRPVTRGFYRGLKTGANLEIAPRERFEMKGEGGESVETTYLDAALAAAAAAAAGIRAGDIAAEPRTASSCRFCCAAGTCPRRAS